MSAIGEDTLVFRLTERQRRRRVWGLCGLALIAWGAGVVRFVVAHRLDRSSGWVALVVLAALLAVAVVWVARVQPHVTLGPEAVVAAWGPWQRQVAREAVTAVEVRERGTARRVVVTHGGGRLVLPVPLTGGSLIGPGPDPSLDEKVEMVRRWWQADDGRSVEP
jgi:hypothetical protein